MIGALLDAEYHALPEPLFRRQEELHAIEMPGNHRRKILIDDIARHDQYHHAAKLQAADGFTKEHFLKTVVPGFVTGLRGIGHHVAVRRI